MRQFLLPVISTILFLYVSGDVFAQGQTNKDLAEQYMSTSEYDKAAVYFEKWYNEDLYNAYGPYLKCLIALEDYKQAEKLIKKQIKKIPNNPVYHVDMGHIAELSGSGKAGDHYREAIESLNPDIQQVLALGNAFIEKRRLGYAEQTYLRGRQLLRGVYPFSFELADVYAQQQEFQMMVNEYLDLLEYSESYLPNVQAILQNKITFDLENKLNDIIRTTLLKRIQRSPDKIVYSQLLYWLNIQEKDFYSALIQAKALDKRLNENGYRILNLGRMAMQNEDYATAEDCFKHILKRGKQSPLYMNAKMSMVEATDLKLMTSGGYTQQDLVGLENEYMAILDEFGRNQATSSVIGKLAHLQAFFLDKTEEAITLLEEAIELPRVTPLFKAECKLELGDILILTGDVWDASLYFSQVDKDFKNEPIGREAKYRNARLSFYLGEFEWAAAQLGVLKAATSQLFSNDAMHLGMLIMDNLGLDSNTTPLMMYSRADLYDFCNRNDDALLVLDSLLIEWPGHSLTDEAWFKQANIHIKKGDYEKATELLAKVVEVYPEDILADDSLFRLADLKENRLGKSEEAKQLYEDLITNYPGSLFTVEARKRYRNLRGDFIN
jgi:tetratricopeptide (TPR) repeat protein